MHPHFRCMMALRAIQAGQPIDPQHELKRHCALAGLVIVANLFAWLALA